MAGGEGSTFGKYFLLKKLALGGMGEIFLAKLKGPVGFEKLLVIKRILQHHVENQEFVDMFFAEARVAARLSHSNVVQIYEMGEIEDCYYIAMEYVHGKTLREVIDRARARGEYVPPELVVQILSNLAEGLSYAHNATNMSGERIGIIHRDINPHNLLISYSGEVKIIDFGIAKSEMSLHKTDTGTIKGKFVYMSPEQSAAEPLDKRSDIFSVGICLYEALTLFNPFAKANVVLSLDAIQRQAPAPLSQTSPRLEPFQPVIDKALAKQREQRYQDCNDLREALQAVRAGGDIEKPRMTLKEYMHDMFEEQIEREKRMILETDSASTSQIEVMKEWLDREHHSGSHPGHRTGISGLGRAAAHISAVQVAELPHSRTPFFLLLMAIVVLAGAAATAVFKLVERQRLGQAIAGLSGPPGSPAVVIESVPQQPESTSDPKAEPKRDDAGEIGKAARLSQPSKRRKRRRRASTPKPAKEVVAVVSADPEPEESSPPPPAPAAPPPPAYGTVHVSTNPPLKIFRGDTRVGQNVKLKNSTGRLVLGTGKDQTSDPFVVTVNYKVEGGQVGYTFNSTPWAIVRDRNGMGIGNTKRPLAWTPSGTTVFEFVNPQQGLRLRVTLRYTR